MYTGVDKIAVGHNNIAALKTWRELNPPCFWRYTNQITKGWIDTTQRMNGDRRYSDFGIVGVRLTFESLSEKEMQYIMDTFFNGGANRDCLVTIKTQNRNTYRWGYFNAIMVRSSIGETAEDSTSGPRNVVLTFYDLEQIP